jgi:hypothetical protein
VGSPQSVSLGGIGATSGTNATLSTTSLTFATELVGTPSPAQQVTLSNYGTMTLDITGIIASWDFSEKDYCGSSPPPGGYCTINVTFTPRQRGPRTGAVSIADNAPHSPQRVHLTGVGTVVKVDPASLDFGSVQVSVHSFPSTATHASDQCQTVWSFRSAGFPNISLPYDALRTITEFTEFTEFLPVTEFLP